MVLIIFNIEIYYAVFEWKTKDLEIEYHYLIGMMRHVLLFLLVIVVFAIAFIMLPSISSPTGFVIAENEENKSLLPDFRLYTKAICTNVSGFVVCHDEMFASCGTFEYMLPKNEVNGQGVFDGDWEDPRNK